MRVVVIYKTESDHAREVFDFLHDFKRRTGREIEQIDPEKPANDFFLKAYDIVQYPTMLALSDDGRVLNVWRGRPLPTIDEVSYYAR